MGEELDAIDRAGLGHNYGSATDVPGLLRHCAGPDRENSTQAAGWHGSVDDETIRAAVTALVTAPAPPADPRTDPRTNP
ncbi:hypothetical protein ACGF12_37120 [Kitasatospora sp. NPDC048296]|uniref:hypothetical protein n=1 Tax=Kitasatospora sp. NPDC048296 TaxID=3364048 RepID=UPI003720AA63